MLKMWPLNQQGSTSHWQNELWEPMVLRNVSIGHGCPQMDRWTRANLNASSKKSR